MLKTPTCKQPRKEEKDLKRRKLRKTPSTSISEKNLKKIDEKAVYAISYSDENGDEITSYWSSKKKADEEQKNLKEYGYTVSRIRKTQFVL